MCLPLPADTTIYTAAKQAAVPRCLSGMRRLAGLSSRQLVVRVSQARDSNAILPASTNAIRRVKSSKEPPFPQTPQGSGKASAAATGNAPITLPDSFLASRLNLHKTIGRVELIMGPMFAGKTSQLIQHARQARAAGYQVLVLKSDKDKRYKVDSLATHDGDHLPCMAISRLLHLHEAHLRSTDVIAIDEGQFFPDLVDFVKLAADKFGKTVYVAGLDGDFKRQRFGQMLDLVPLADHVHKLHTHCYMLGCSQPAIFSMRKSAQTEQEVVGGADKYTAACRAHYQVDEEDWQ